MSYQILRCHLSLSLAAASCVMRDTWPQETRGSNLSAGDQKYDHEGSGWGDDIPTEVGLRGPSIKVPTGVPGSSRRAEPASPGAVADRWIPNGMFEIEDGIFWLSHLSRVGFARCLKGGFQSIKVLDEC